MERRHLIGNDITVSFDTQLWDFDSGLQQRAVRPGVGGFSGRVVALEDPDADSAGTEWLVSRLEERQGVQARTLASLVRRPGTAARALDATTAPQIEIELAEGEAAAVLTESEGVVSWVFPEAVEPIAGVPGGLRAYSATVRRRARFSLTPTAGASASGSAQRGLLTDWALKPLKTVVLKFVARHAADALVSRLERDKRTGPVVLSAGADPSEWEQPADFAALFLHQKPARLLLFVHGTFSSTVGGFGELCATAWGKALLDEAAEQYDALIGYDHCTLSVDPLANARGLYEALRTLPGQEPPTIDIICHSRGGLVARALIEKILPAAPWRPRIGRVVFTAATNAGTRLASPRHWHALVDLMTNLALAGRRALALLGAPQVAMVAGEVVDSIGDFVRYLVETAVVDQRVPGLAAMDPDGVFVRDINLVEADAPAPSDAQYYAITSDFHPVLLGDAQHEPREFPRRLALLLADGLVDTLMAKVGNDLVVDAASMTAIDLAAGRYVKAVKDYGRNPLVYHTNYFLQPETVDAVAQWLELALPNAARWVHAQARLLNTSITVADAHETLADVARVAHEQEATHVVIRRSDPNGGRTLLYTPRIEVLDARLPGAAHEPLDSALGLQMLTPSPVLASGPALRSISLRQRLAAPTVVLDDGRPVGLVTVPGTETAVDLLARASAPARRQLRGSKEHASPATPPEPMTASQAAPLVCQALAEMPAQVAVRQRATVTVTLSADEAVVAAVGHVSTGGPTRLHVNRPVVIEVLPKAGFVLHSDDISDSRVEFPHPPAAGEPWVVDVDVVATHAGPGEVWAIVRQGPVRVITLVLRSQIVDDAPVAPAPAVVTREGSVAADEDLPDVATLGIWQQRNGEETRFRYDVSIPGEAFNRFESPALKGDVVAWVGTLYKGIEDAWLGSAGDRALFEDSLRAKGSDIVRQLMPQQLRQLLWRLRVQGKLQSLLVHSDEPFVPWEVGYLDDPQRPGHEQAGFLGQMGLCRWLYGAVPATRIRIGAGRLRYIVPHYPVLQYRLAAAEEVEQPMLQQLGAQPIEPHYVPVRDALRAGGFDLLHFAGHGGADSGAIGDAALLLQGSFQTVEGTRSYVTEPLPVSNVVMNVRLRDAEGNRPLVLLNACQVGRLGFSLTSIGGFAPAFLGVREGESDAVGEAGAFVGSLWSVGDQPASVFATTLYEALRVPGGATLGQATIRAREAAREAGDATWLAYAVYAHPNCRVEFTA